MLVCIASIRGLHQRLRDTRTAAAVSRSMDEQVRREVERAIDGLIRRGEISDDNIRAAVREITEVYYGKRVGDGDQ